MCWLLAAWLSLCAGVSRKTVNTVLRCLHFIITTIVTLIYISLQTSGHRLATATPMVNIPKDIRTVYKHTQLDPELIRIFCCPSCFTQYPADSTLRKCTWRKSPKSKPCNTDMWTSRHTKTGLKSIPKCLYTTQGLGSWLKFFLNRPKIDECLSQAFSKLQNPNPIYQDKMCDIQESPAWQSLRGFLTSKYHLVFAVYIDWFNPYTNKIAGKVVSCGAIILYCLNLPPEIRFLPENVFIIGMMPAPHSPTIWTISHILVSFQRAIAEFDLPGKIIPTHSYPGRITVAIRIILLIADLQAIRKVAGFLSHAAGLFCSFCNCHRDDIKDLDYNSWQMCDGATVRAQAAEWKNLVTVTAKETLARQTGVWWTPMHDFSYWNPTKHVVLGFMHNFLEGVLAYQLRALWGIGRTKEMVKKIAQILDDENNSSVDTEEFIQESQDLENEAEQASQHGSATGLTEDFNDMDVDDIGEESSNYDEEHDPSPTPQLFILLDDGEDEMDEDFVPQDIETAFNFTPDQLGNIRNCIQYVLLPASSDHPPRNLGEASHGKLKAHELLILFTVILPLVIPELWWRGNETEIRRLQSFCDLVVATNIICAYSTSNVEADIYMDHFVKYHVSIQELYPGFSSMPNHHYAMHGGDQLKFWGPLALLSEFPGERMNGNFGQVKTNKHLGDMELTMVQKSACKGRLEGLLHDNQFTNPATQKLAKILEPRDVFAFMSTPETMTGSQIAKALSDGEPLSKTHYAILLKYMNNSG
ncbi:hypothetical protein F5876DRAFT_27538, partial [Lentinula aff. lateritia]